MRLPIKALLLGLALSGAGAGSAAAACTQADLAGTWDFYVTQNGFIDEGDEEAEAFVSWVTCTVRLTANGTIQPGANCTDAFEQRSTLTGGRVALEASCAATGLITVRGASSEPVRNRIVRATLTADKGLLVGVVTNPSGGPLVLQAVKR